MPRLPSLEKFRGDNSQSFKRWILMFEAQLSVLGTEDNKKKETLLCLLDGQAFTFLSSYIANNAAADYAALKIQMITKFCGVDYKRALETKYRTLSFTKDTDISVYCNEIRLIIKELFDIDNTDVIDKIAVNHTLGTMDQTIRDHVEMLQLAGTARLEVLLECAKSKMANSMLTNTCSAEVKDDDRLTRLERMMEGLMSTMGPTGVGAGAIRRRICEECGRTGHDKDYCFKLKTCFHCEEKGHISRFCPKKKAKSSKTSIHENELVLNLEKSPRIFIDIGLDDYKTNFLYDPGSQYTLITMDTYNKLPSKPVLRGTSHCGIGVSSVPFKLEGLIYVNCTFYNKDGGKFTLPGEPILVSSAIDGNIFGIHTERRFEGIKRSHSNSEIIFTTTDGEEINLKYFSEDIASNSSAYVKVMRAAVIEPHSCSIIEGKIQDMSTAKGNPVLVESTGDQDLITMDIVVNELTSKRLSIPVFNNNDEELSVTKNMLLGRIRGIKAPEPIMSSYKCSQATLSENCSTERTERKVDLTEEQKEKINEALRVYKDKLELHVNKKTTIPFEHGIDLTDDIPVSQQPRRIPYALRSPIKSELQNLLDSDYIEPSQSIYGSPIIPVLKKDGTIRIAIDYRSLNKKTIPRRYPIPHQADLIEKVNGANVFSVFDLKQGYFNIPMKAADQHKTAFIVPWGKFQWKRLPLGLLGAPFTFGEAMQYLFRDIPFVVVYFDDILIFSQNVDDHIKHVKTVLERLAEYNFKINDTKSQLFLKEVLFLGFRVSGEGVRIDANKIQKVTSFETPKNHEDLSKFLGLTGFLRRFIPQYSIIATPLYDQLKSKNRFNWTEECQEHFETIKAAVTNAPLLSHPNFNKPFILYVDAAGKGIGFFLAQEEHGKLNYITFGGRVLADREQRYPVLDKELLAVYYAVKSCFVYVCRQEFIVYSDHKPLTDKYVLRDIIGRRFRWLNYLEEVGTKILYIKGKSNVIADFISRNIKDIPAYKMINIHALEFHSLLYDNDDIIAAQRNDTNISKLFDYVSNSNENGKDVIDKSYRKHLDKIYVDDNGILRYKRKHCNCIIAPEMFHQEVMQLCHATYLSGHQGVFKTHQRILKRFWWPKLYEDVTEFIKNCTLCLKVKPEYKKKGLMGMRSWPTKPLDFISIDFLVDLPPSNRGNRHILVVNDHFSKFIKLYPIQNRVAETAAKCLVDYFLQYGIPGKLLSDQDPAYESKLFLELMRLLEIKKLRTSGYRPQVNGLTEQSNSMIKNYLTTFLDEYPDKNNWDLLLTQLCYAYNTSIHSSTGYTPVELMFGRAFRIPSDILYGGFESSHFYSIKEFQKQLSLMYRIASENMNLRQRKMKSQYDKKRRDDKLAIGDHVLVFNPRLKNVKLEAKWYGPYVISRKSDHVYEVQLNVQGKERLVWLPRDRLRKVNQIVVQNFLREVNDTSVQQEDVSIPERDDHHEYSNDSSSSDDENGAPRYNLRPRPRPVVNRFEACKLNFFR